MKVLLLLTSILASRVCPAERICEKEIVFGANLDIQQPPTDTPPQPLKKEKEVVLPKHTKEGFNYASFDCGAVIRASNKESKNPTAILLNAKDAYLLSPCSSNIFVEVELCQDILVRSITLANFEYFSSMFKDFQVFGSSGYPPDWKALGSFSAKNSRDRQFFSIENPVIWTKYIKIVIQSHYGNEYYCPLTSLQVFGTSMMEEAKEYQNLKPVEEVVLKTNSSSLIDSPVTSRTQEPLKPTSLATCPDVQPTQEEIDSLTTALPTPTKQESIFAKIIQRLSLLEKATQDLVNDLTEFRKLFAVKQEEYGASLETIETKLRKTISELMAEQDVELKQALQDLDKQRDNVDKKLEDVMEVVGSLRTQLSWSQFWNQVLFFVCILAVKVVNDRLGLWRLLFKERNEHRIQRLD